MLWTVGPLVYGRLSGHDPARPYSVQVVRYQTGAGVRYSNQRVDFLGSWGAFKQRSRFAESHRSMSDRRFHIAANWIMSCARLCHLAGGELEQIQFLLGHVSVQTTERYLGYKQKLRNAVNDDMGLNL